MSNCTHDLTGCFCSVVPGGSAPDDEHIQTPVLAHIQEVLHSSDPHNTDELLDKPVANINNNNNNLLFPHDPPHSFHSSRNPLHETPPHLLSPSPSVTVPPNTPIPPILPAPPGIDPQIWQMNQAMMLSLLPMFTQLLASAGATPPPAQAPMPGHSRKEGNAKPPTAFMGKDHSKLRDFLFECGLIFDLKPYMFATEKSRILYTLQHLDRMAK